MSSKYNIDAPDELWDEWKKTVTRRYPRLGDRVLDLLALDLICQQENGYGILEYADRDGNIDAQTVKQCVEQAQQAETEDADTSDT